MVRRRPTALVLTLVGLGLDPSRLTDGLRKLTQFNEMLGGAAHARDYPQLQERERFMKALRELSWHTNGRISA